jgi:hypothetical protein
MTRHRLLNFKLFMQCVRPSEFTAHKFYFCFIKQQHFAIIILRANFQFLDRT